jgi:hypothetical protein
MDGMATDVSLLIGGRARMRTQTSFIIYEPSTSEQFFVRRARKLQDKQRAMRGFLTKPDGKRALRRDVSKIAAPI